MKKCCLKWKKYNFCPVCNNIFKKPQKEIVKKIYSRLNLNKYDEIRKLVEANKYLAKDREQILDGEIRKAEKKIKRKITFKYICYCIIVFPVYLILKIKQFIKWLNYLSEEGYIWKEKKK